MRKSAAEVRKEGWLYRESGYVNGLVNPRYGAIYPHALVTFRSVQTSDQGSGSGLGLGFRVRARFRYQAHYLAAGAVVLCSCHGQSVR